MARLSFIAGLIQSTRKAPFERLLFRSTRGNVFFKSVDVGPVRDPATGELQDKSVFVVFFAGERARNKGNKVGRDGREMRRSRGRAEGKWGEDQQDEERVPDGNALQVP